MKWEGCVRKGTWYLVSQTCTAFKYVNHMIRPFGDPEQGAAEGQKQQSYNTICIIFISLALVYLYKIIANLITENEIQIIYNVTVWKKFCYTPWIRQ